jgi:hypothetical protein
LNQFKHKKHIQVEMAFNGDSVVAETVKKLVNTLNIEVIVETGTHLGTTTEFLAQTFPTLKIYTIETNFSFFVKAENRLEPYSNVKCLHGGSEMVLGSLLPLVKDQRVLFYLDAHWYDFWPLKDELKMISRHCIDNCAIIIDDFKVPNRNFRFDSYKNEPLDLKFIEPIFDKCITNPIIFFNDRSTRKEGAVGKFYAFPKHWEATDFKNTLVKDGVYYYVK